MTYQRTPNSMGDVTATLVSAIGAASTAVNKITEVATDPYTPELVCRVGQLAAIRGKRPVPDCQNTPLTYDDQMGFRKIMWPVRAYVYGEQNPWAYPAAIGAILGIPFLLGYWLGKD